MKRSIQSVACCVAVLVFSIAVSSGAWAAEGTPSTKSPAAVVPGVEISTEELKQILLEGKTPVIDVRPEKEYGVSHIPGAVNIFETEIERMMAACPDKSVGPVLYCNGPLCHKTGRVAETLAKNGYTNVKRYQSGLPVWRAFGNPAETNLAGFKYVLALDKTAVFVDARSVEEFKTRSLPGAVNLQSTEIEAANKDGRLPYTDHGTRVIVFGKTAAQARQLAESIAQRAYWNSGYLAATFDELIQMGL